MKKERKMSKKRSKHIILNSRNVERLVAGTAIKVSIREIVKKSTVKSGINPIDKEKVKADIAVKAEAKVKLVKVKAMRKLRDAKQLEAHKANMAAREEHRTAIAEVEAEAKLKAREETKLKKELKAIARADAKTLYLKKKADKKANKIGINNSRTKRKKLQLEVNNALENAA